MRAMHSDLNFELSAFSDAFYELQDWRREANSWTSASPTRIPLSDVRQWDTGETSPAFGHASGMFFSIIGVQHGIEGRGSRSTDAMIDQPEVGLLGLAVSQLKNGMVALIQAKAEPGTIGGCQLSPTVQATCSNQLQAHGGKPVPFLDLFRAPVSVLLDTVQTEHGSVFWQKRNRSMIVTVPYFDPPLGFRWVDIADLYRLLAVDNLIHSDLRTVLALGPFWTRCRGASLISEALAIKGWLDVHRSKNKTFATRIPLQELEGWQRDAYRLHRGDGTGHEVIGVRVHAQGREVDYWDQLMVRPKFCGLVALAVRNNRGVLQALMRICVEPGTKGFTEIGPTVQVAGGDLPTDCIQTDLARSLAFEAGQVKSRKILYDSVLSDEGGRFFRSEVRYVVVDSNMPPPGEGYRWCDVKALVSTARSSTILNIQARDALACLLSTAY